MFPQKVWVTGLSLYVLNFSKRFNTENKINSDIQVVLMNSGVDVNFFCQCMFLE